MTAVVTAFVGGCASVLLTHADSLSTAASFSRGAVSSSLCPLGRVHGFSMDYLK